MWMHFPMLKNTVGQEEIPDKISKWAKEKALLYLACFNTPGGTILHLGDPVQVNSVIAEQLVYIPLIKDEPIQVTACRQIKIENAFELVTTGTHDYDFRLQTHIIAWFQHNYCDEDNQQSLFHLSRTSQQDQNVLIFSMVDWQSTARVICDVNKFRNAFMHQFPSLMPSQLVWRMNMAGALSVTLTM
jgi:hypothetical protein